MSQLAESVVQQLRIAHPEREVAFENHPSPLAHGDPPLLRAVLENLLGNAWKFTNATPAPRLVFGCSDAGAEAERAYYVGDNGAGFDMAYVKKLFTPFQRLHTTTEFAGTGIGLATVQRIIARHGGRVWAEGAVGKGAKFYFTLPSHHEGARA
jgi:light-regulated signal transduction histidine kinase (bacteriophytochrome)